MKDLLNRIRDWLNQDILVIPIIILEKAESKPETKSVRPEEAKKPEELTTGEKPKPEIKVEASKPPEPRKETPIEEIPKTSHVLPEKSLNPNIGEKPPIPKEGVHTNQVDLREKPKTRYRYVRTYEEALEPTEGGVITIPARPDGSPIGYQPTHEELTSGKVRAVPDPTSPTGWRYEKVG